MSGDQKKTGTAQPLQAQLAAMAELVATGPVDMGCYTQAEMAVVLGEVTELAGMEDDVVAEGVRSLAARGLLYRSPDGEHVDVVGELGLVSALMPLTTSSLEIRRGHDVDPDAPWRWLIALLPHNVAAVDRIDALGLHRIAMISRAELMESISERMLDASVAVPRKDAGPVPVSIEEVREVIGKSARWQLINRRLLPDGSSQDSSAIVVRTGENRADIVTLDPDGGSYHRTAIDRRSLTAFLADFTGLA